MRSLNLTPERTRGFNQTTSCSFEVMSIKNLLRTQRPLPHNTTSLSVNLLRCKKVRLCHQVRGQRPVLLSVTAVWCPVTLNSRFVSVVRAASLQTKCSITSSSEAHRGLACLFEARISCKSKFFEENSSLIHHVSTCVLLYADILYKLYLKP